MQQFGQLATEENPNIQMVLPMAEIVGFLQQGVGHLMREAGLALMSLVMEEEVRHLAGERHGQRPERRAHRWGKEDGYCIIDGQKVPLKRTRLRTKDNREQRLGSYELFQRSAPLQDGVWDKITRGLSTRNYSAVVKDFTAAYGIEKSAGSENFIEASRESSGSRPPTQRGRRSRMAHATNRISVERANLGQRRSHAASNCLMVIACWLTVSLGIVRRLVLRQLRVGREQRSRLFC